MSPNKSPSDCWHGCHVRSHSTARKSGCNTVTRQGEQAAPGSHHSTQKQVSPLKPVPTLIFKDWFISPHTPFISHVGVWWRWTAGYLAIWDWLGFLRHWQWVAGSCERGSPWSLPTHTCLCRIPLHFQPLFRLESGGSKQVHSSPCPVWSHNTQPTELCDPPSLSKCKGSFFVLILFFF